MPKYLSKNSRTILLRMLNKDPKKRPSMDQLKKDPFFEGIDWSKLEQKKYKPPTKLGKVSSNPCDERRENLDSIFHDSITSDQQDA